MPNVCILKAKSTKRILKARLEISCVYYICTFAYTMLAITYYMEVHYENYKRKHEKSPHALP